MAFIDELIRQGGLPFGMEIVEEPKAHDEIDSLLEWDDAKMGMSQEDLMNIVMGTVGGGVGKGLRQLMLALKGKIKGGKMIPSQPIHKGIIGKPALDPLKRPPALDPLGRPPVLDALKRPPVLDALKRPPILDALKRPPAREGKSSLIDNILKNIEQRDPRYVNYGRGKEGASSIDNLIPFLLLSLMEGDMGGEHPNIGRTSKQY